MDKWAVLGQGRRTADPRRAADPASTQPLHASTQPVPASTQPLHASTQPVPAFTQPLHASTQPVPAFTQPLHASTQPVPAFKQPLHASTQPVPASTQPVPASPPFPPSLPSLASTQPLPEHLMVSLELWKNYVHGLSQIEFHHRSGRDLPAWSHASQSDREHVASLDGLALLLVFKPKGDIAAISSWRSAHEFKLLWAKNQPVDDPNQLRYIDELLEKIKKDTPARELLKIVIPMCREKIFYRVKKLANSFGVSQTDQRRGESNLWRLDETGETYQTLTAKLKKAKRLKDNESTVHLLDRFTRFVGRVTKTSKTGDFWTILYFSWCVTSVAGLNKILGESQVRYLSKLGDYVRILKRIPLLLKKLDKEKLTIEQVRPPAAEPIEVLSGSLEILNLRCNEIVSDDLTEIEDWDLVTDAYENAQPGQPTVGKKTVNFTQHCEITLALDMLKRTQPKLNKPKPNEIKSEIGVSKTCCEWCCEYLNLLASVYPHHSILVRASHGKQPDGWMMPPNSPTSITQQMIRVIEERIDHVIWKIVNRRRSDSNELPEFMAEDDMETDAQDMEEEMVDF